MTSYRELAANEALEHLYSPSGAIGQRIAKLEQAILRPGKPHEQTEVDRATRLALLSVREEIVNRAREEAAASQPPPQPQSRVSALLERAGLQPLRAMRLRAMGGRE